MIINNETLKHYAYRGLAENTRTFYTSFKLIKKFKI